MAAAVNLQYSYYLKINAMHALATAMLVHCQTCNCVTAGALSNEQQQHRVLYLWSLNHGPSCRTEKSIMLWFMGMRRQSSLMLYMVEFRHAVKAARAIEAAANWSITD